LTAPVAVFTVALLLIDKILIPDIADQPRHRDFGTGVAAIAGELIKLHVSATIPTISFFILGSLS
jgi:hypothetical protein